MQTFRLQYIALVIIATVFLYNTSVFAEETDPAELIKSKEIGFYTELGANLPLSIEFFDQEGNNISFGQLLKPAQPTIFVPLYFGCPRLCGLLSEGFIDLIKELDLKLGQEYNIVTLSFDPTEDHKLAAQVAQAAYSKIAPKSANPSNWRFITGSEQSIQQILEAVGFKYKFVAGEYIHSAGFFVLTPQGEISQYFTGIQFSAWDVRLALIEASKGAIGSTVDHILLYCFDFDPAKGKYTWVAFNILRFGALLAVMLFVAVAVLLVKKIKVKN